MRVEEGVKGSLGPGVCPHGRHLAGKWASSSGEKRMDVPYGQSPRAPPPTTDSAAYPSWVAPRPAVPSARSLLVFLLLPAPATCSLCVSRSVVSDSL